MDSPAISTFHTVATPTPLFIMTRVSSQHTSLPQLSSHFNYKRSQYHMPFSSHVVLNFRRASHHRTPLATTLLSPFLGVRITLSPTLLSLNLSFVELLSHSL